jgi:hypothetical protein
MAQLPTMMIPPSSSSSTYTYNFDSITNLYIELFADSAADWSGNASGGASPGKWLDRTAKHNDFTNGSASAHFIPNYLTGGGPTNGYYVDFSTNVASGIGAVTLQCANSPGSNQPNVIFMVARVVNATYFDVASGAREQFHARTVGDTPNQTDMYAGTIAAAKAFPVVQNWWVVLTCVFNGSLSYVRTNGVLMSGGLNPNTQGMGKMLLGNDQTWATPFTGRMAAVLVAGIAPETNYLQTIEKSLSAKYGHIFADGL